MPLTLHEKIATDFIRRLIPADSEGRVSQAVKRFSPVLREIIRSETGLRLSDGASRVSLPVRVVDGVPAELAEVIARNPDPLLWRLLALRGQFEEGKNTLGALAALRSQLMQWDNAPYGLLELLPSVDPAKQLLTMLAELKGTQEIEEGIIAINKDILGQYFIPTHAAPFIEIYWMPIALIALILNVFPEDLAAVVLTHELAHGYTHIGKDIDGEAWDRDAFCTTSDEVVEGLAQHYTAVVTERLGNRAPGTHEAYKKLLQRQRGPYRVHEQWLKDHPERRGEAVRFALLAARRADPMMHDTWLALLNRISAQLRNGGKPGVTFRLT